MHAKAMNKESIFIMNWVQQMGQLLSLVFPYRQKEEIDNYLFNYAKANISNKPVVLINNYRNRTVKTTILEVIDAIENEKLIIGGDGVLYIQHSVAENPLIGYILHVMHSRKLMKKKRDEYVKYSDEWVAYDIKQLNFKILINSLYGVLGYKRFLLSNRFLAQSITNQGKQIITTAVCTFENFLSDNVDFVTSSEMFVYITNILNEYSDIVKKYGKLRTDLFKCSGDFRLAVRNRLLKKCAFDIKESHIKVLDKILCSCNEQELFMLYYKNNLYEFNKLSFVREKLNSALISIEELRSADISSLNEDVQKILTSLLEFYYVFVVYDYPIYDRVRKAMFTKKKSVLYVDTDSNFIGLDPLIRHIKKDMLEANINKSDEDINIQIVNIYMYYCQQIVNNSLKTFGIFSNITEEWASKIEMKNEYYIRRILFAKEKKKRYVADVAIQEGKVLDPSLDPDIKGFDFKKSTTKPTVKKFYTLLCKEYIMRADYIDVPSIYKELIIFKKEIERSMKAGESLYFKQMNVKKPEHYKKPYSTQQIPAVLLWNTLCPNYAIELPGDVDIVPIKELCAKKKIIIDKTTGEKKCILDFSSNKNIQWLKEKYPEYYERFETNIMNNDDIMIRKMSLSSIAKPKNPNIPIPPWFSELINTDKVTNDTIGLFLPIMESLGLRPQRATANTQYLSNIVSL